MQLNNNNNPETVIYKLYHCILVRTYIMVNYILEIVGAVIEHAFRSFNLATISDSAT